MSPQRRLSLDCRVGELRRLYTGQNDSTLWPAVKHGMGSLTGDNDREKVLQILNSGYETRLLGEPATIEADARHRSAVLADTTNPTQQQLEAAILFALGKIDPNPSASTSVPLRMRPAVQPVDETVTVLYMPPTVVAQLLAAVLPRVVNGRVHGLPGLRTRTYQRHVRLYIADSADTRVDLATTNKRWWSAALAFASAATGHGWPHDFQDPLTEAEQAAGAAGRVSCPVALASALLRRVRVVGATTWLRAHEEGPCGIRVEWAGGRSAATVAAALVHPLAGLPGERFVVVPAAGGTIAITITDTDGCPARLVLHQELSPAPPPDNRSDLAAAWAAFDRVATMPDPGTVSPLADRQ